MQRSLLREGVEMFWNGEIVCQKGNVGALCDAVVPPLGSWDLLQTIEEVLINLGVQKVGEWKAIREQVLGYRAVIQ